MIEKPHAMKPALASSPAVADINELSPAIAEVPAVAKVPAVADAIPSLPVISGAIPSAPVASKARSSAPASFAQVSNSASMKASVVPLNEQASQFASVSGNDMMKDHHISLAVENPAAQAQII